MHAQEHLAEDLSLSVNSPPQIIMQFCPRSINRLEIRPPGQVIKKKETSPSYGTGGGIMPLSIPSKVLTSIILQRLKKALDKKLRPKQVWFRQDRSCTDHIATHRIIIQQSIERQSSLYITCVDFTMAFDSEDRDVIHRLMIY